MAENTIDVKAAVRIAMDYLRGLQEFVPSRGLRLEETEYDDAGAWLITLSTVDPEDMGSGLFSTDAMRQAAGLDRAKRIYKVFRIDAGTGAVLSMKVRSLIPLE